MVKPVFRFALLGAFLTLAACQLDWGVPAYRFDAGHLDAGPSFSRVQRSCGTGTPGCGLVEVGLPDGGVTFSLGNASVPNAAPAIPVRLTASFDVDAYEVTVARFRAFWEAGHPSPGAHEGIAYPGGHTLSWDGAWSATEPSTAGPGLELCTWTRSGGANERLPINCVDWKTAEAFCVWDGARLPTEAEREYLVRQSTLGQAPAPRDFPWGNSPPSDCSLMEWGGCGPDAGLQPVGSFPPFAGIYDLAGNAGEWCADVWAAYGVVPCWNLAVVGSDPLCLSGPDTNLRVARGGDFSLVDPVYFNTASRGSFDIGGVSSTLGLRCVRTLPGG